MPTNHSRTHPQHFVVAILLAMALLFAQWAGLVHSVAHAGWESGLQQRAVTSELRPIADMGGTGHHHSCLEFNAATLAASIHSVTFIPLLPPLVYVPIVEALLVSWDGLPAYYFSPRAPPSACV
jgi:hypothetical protein